MNDSWTGAALQRLLDAHVTRAGWPYRLGGTPFSESTALAALAVLAASPQGTVEPCVSQGADWLAEIQQPDGSVGLNAEIATPAWATPYAVLLWSALGDYRTERRRAVDWLLAAEGTTFEPDENAGHDPSIPGWPWLPDTHSWLEPTSMAVMALRREGLTAHPRTQHGIRLIENRALPSGGWNVGSVSVFDSELRPHPGPTGLAILALASRDDATGHTQAGCDYLLRTLPRMRTPRSLGWAVLGLEAWGKRPTAADAWLAESYSRILPADLTPMDLAQLLLAASSQALDLLDFETAAVPVESLVESATRTSPIEK